MNRLFYKIPFYNSALSKDESLHHTQQQLLP